MTAIEISGRLNYCLPEKTGPLLKEADQIAAMIVGLAKSLRTTPQLGKSRESDKVYSTDF